MRFKLLLVSGLFGVGIFLLPFTYALEIDQTTLTSMPTQPLLVAQAQTEPAGSWSWQGLWSSVLRQIDGVMSFAAQTVDALLDAPDGLFDVTSNNPPGSPGEVQNFDPAIAGAPVVPGVPVPQIYDGTLIINVPLVANNTLSVAGLTTLTDLLVLGEFEINDLSVPGVGTFGSIVSGATQLSSLSVAGNTQLNTLSVTGPVTFANLTANNLSAGNLTVTNTLFAQSGLRTGGANVDLEGGDIFAANIINSLVAGDNIEIDFTDPNAPVITADVPRISLGSRVRTLNDQTGNLTIVGGSDISVSVSGENITLANTSDLDTVTGRGGCTDCILDAYVVDALTVASGTIDATVIGSTTPAQAYFTTVTITGTATSTFAGPINVTSGCVAVNGVCLGIGATNLTDLLDVTISSPANGDFLRYNGSVWANASSGALQLGDGTFLGLSDTPSSYTANALVFVNGAGNALTQSADLSFDGSLLAVGTSSALSTLTVGGSVSVLDREAVRFYETNNTNYVGFRASSTLATDTIWTLPAGDGSFNQVLVTDGSGNLRFDSVGLIGGGATVFLGLTDTPSAYVASAIPFTATTSDQLRFVSTFMFDEDNGWMGLGTDTPTDELTVHGSMYLGRNASTPGISYDDTTNRVSIGTTLTEEKLTVAQGSIVQRGGTSTEQYAPALFGSVNMPDSTYNLAIDGDRAYTVGRSSSAEFNVIDISNKQNPTILGFVNLPDTARDIAVQGNYVFVVTDVSGDDFHVIDVSNPNTPLQVASLPLTTSAFSVTVHGRYAFVGTGVIAGDEFFVIDILDPTTPIAVGSLNVAANVNAIAVQGDYAYVVTDSPSNLISILITDPTAPVVVDTVALPAAGTDIRLRGDHAFVVTNLIGDDFHVFDISDPTSLSSISSTPLTTGANGVSVAGYYAYVTTSGTGNDLHVIDISDLSDPVEVGSVELNSGAAWGVQVRGRYAYLTSDSVGNDFHIYDVTGIEAQSLLAHSLESGNLSVIGNMVAAGSVNFKQGLRVGADGIETEGVLLVRSASSSLILGNLAVGTTTAPYGLTVGGDMAVAGAFYDSSFTAGLNGQVLVANGSGQLWTATSSLGLSGAFTTSAGLAGLISDETGSGSVVFSASPDLTGTASFENATFDQVAIGTTSLSQTLRLYDATSAGLLIESSGGDATIDLDAGSGAGDFGAITFYKGGAFTNQIYTGADTDDNLYLDTSTANSYVIMEGAGLAVGTTTPTATLSVEGTIMASNLYGGGITGLSSDAQGNIIHDPSDGRLKTNVRSIENGLEIVLALRGVKYEWIDTGRFGDQTEVGFIAQEVDLILPEVVRKGGEYWSLNTQNILAVVIEAMQEMWVVITGNEEKIELLESRVEYLEALLGDKKRSPGSTETRDTEEASDIEPEATETTSEPESNTNTDSGAEVADPETVPPVRAGENDDQTSPVSGSTEPSPDDTEPDETVVDHEEPVEVEDQTDETDSVASEIATQDTEDLQTQTAEPVVDETSETTTAE